MIRMFPILYDSKETEFISNGLGRLRDCISCVVTEERNGIYECDFEYPVTGVNFDRIQLGRVVGVTHDDSGDIEPFDIVSYTRPIDGVVTFHCVHISYRLSRYTVIGSQINSLDDALALFGNAVPTIPFRFSTSMLATGYLAAADGKPHSVRELMGTDTGAILDVYGGEYSFNNFNVYLQAARGKARDFAIRYGVNMVDYTEDGDNTDTFSSCIPYWASGDSIIIGNQIASGGRTASGRDECVPLDLSGKFEGTPTQSDVEAMALEYMSQNNVNLPKQTINVDFVRLQDYELGDFINLLQCNLCDIIKVYFPMYNSSGQFKIVKTVWDVLQGRYESMELGSLSITLAEALGINKSGTSTSLAIQSASRSASNALSLKSATLENALCEEDTSTDTRLATIEDALCELDKEESR